MRTVVGRLQGQRQKHTKKNIGVSFFFKMEGFEKSTANLKKNIYIYFFFLIELVYLCTCVSLLWYSCELAFNLIHLRYLRVSWGQLGSIGFTLVHLGSLWFTLVHLGSLGFTWVHFGSLWLLVLIF